MSHMNDSVTLEVKLPNEIIGGSRYTVTVTVRNAGPEDLNNLEVAPQLIAGRLLSRQIEVHQVDTRTAEMQRSVLIGELETFVRVAYESQKVANMSIWQRIASWFVIFPELATPEEALRINEWSDVEALEQSLITTPSTSKIVKSGFAVARDKLYRQLGNYAGPLRQPSSLSPGSSIAFPFLIKAPHLWRPWLPEMQFNVTYHEARSGRTAARTISAQSRLLPSSFAIPLGGLVGGITGQIIQNLLRTSASTTSVWAFLGYALLGLVLALLTERRPDTVKTVSVEDFWGGVLVGVLAGLFGDEILARLAAVVTMRSAG